MDSFDDDLFAEEKEDEEVGLRGALGSSLEPVEQSKADHDPPGSHSSYACTSHVAGGPVYAVC
jgi:hypothetical protein